MYCMLQEVDSLQSSAQSLQVQTSEMFYEVPKNELMVHNNTW
jgi:hypothetical protein